MDKSTKSKLADILLMVTACIVFIAVMWPDNKRFEILECRLQVQAARIDVLNGLEITQPECLDDLLGPRNKRKARPEKKPAKQT